MHLSYVSAVDAKPIFHFTKHYNWVKTTEAVFRRCYVKCVIFYNFAKSTGKHLCWSLVMAVKWISANGCFWFLEIHFYSSKYFSGTGNHTHTKGAYDETSWKCFLNFFFDHKDYEIFDNALSIVIKNFPEPIRLETNSTLQDGSNLKTLIGRESFWILKKMEQKS